MANAANYLLLKDALTVAAQIVKWLGPGVVGLVLIEAHYSGQPWLSAAQLGHRANCSEDTARRRADDLANCRRATKKRIGGRVCYAIEPRIADLIVAHIRSLAERSPQSAAGPCGFLLDA